MDESELLENLLNNFLSNPLENQGILCDIAQILSRTKKSADISNQLRRLLFITLLSDSPYSELVSYYATALSEQNKDEAKLYDLSILSFKESIRKIDPSLALVFCPTEMLQDGEFVLDELSKIGGNLDDIAQSIGIDPSSITKNFLPYAIFSSLQPPADLSTFIPKSLFPESKPPKEIVLPSFDTTAYSMTDAMIRTLLNERLRLANKIYDFFKEVTLVPFSEWVIPIKQCQRQYRQFTVCLDEDTLAFHSIEFNTNDHIFLIDDDKIIFSKIAEMETNSKLLLTTNGESSKFTHVLRVTKQMQLRLSALETLSHGISVDYPSFYSSKNSFVLVKSAPYSTAEIEASEFFAEKCLSKRTLVIGPSSASIDRFVQLLPNPRENLFVFRVSRFDISMTHPIDVCLKARESYLRLIGELNGCTFTSCSSAISYLKRHASEEYLLNALEFLRPFEFLMGDKKRASYLIQYGASVITITPNLLPRFAEYTFDNLIVLDTNAMDDLLLLYSLENFKPKQVFIGGQLERLSTIHVVPQVFHVRPRSSEIYQLLKTLHPFIEETQLLHCPFVLSPLVIESINGSLALEYPVAQYIILKLFGFRRVVLVGASESVRSALFRIAQFRFRKFRQMLSAEDFVLFEDIRLKSVEADAIIGCGLGFTADLEEQDILSSLAIAAHLILWISSPSTPYPSDLLPQLHLPSNLNVENQLCFSKVHCASERVVLALNESSGEDRIAFNIQCPEHLMSLAYSMQLQTVAS